MTENGEQPEQQPEQQPEPEQQVEEQVVAVELEVVRVPRVTSAEATEDGGMVISFVVNEYGTPVQHTWRIGQPGRKVIGDAAASGSRIQVARQMPGGKRGRPRR